MGPGFCSLYSKNHYIEVHYIKVWVFFRVECTKKVNDHDAMMQCKSSIKIILYNLIFFCYFWIEIAT